MKRRWLWGILIGILILALVFTLILLVKKFNLTGEVIKQEVVLLDTTTYTTNSGGVNSGNAEKIILDENQYLERARYYSQSFVVSEVSKIFVSLDSDNPVNYALLPESQISRYKNDKSFTSYGVRTKLMFLEENYELKPGSYSIVISTLNKPASFHLVIKEASK